MLSNSNFCLGNDEVGGRMSEKLIDIKLELKSKVDGLNVTVIFTNVSMKPVFLDKNNVDLGDELKSRLFDICYNNKNRINYTGITIKRRFDKNDFIKLEPNQSIVTSVNLSKWYDFPDGEYEYTIKYDAINHSFEEQKIFEMISNTVVVKFKK